MPRILAITNQKGGVGKTTTTMNLGAGLRLRRKKVLFIDMDPQCSLTYIMGGDSEGWSVKDLMVNPGLDPVVTIQQLKEGDLIPSHRELGTVEMILTGSDRAYRLNEALKKLGNRYDYIVIDSPPALSVLTVNIMTAASGVIVPALPDIFSLQGVGELYGAIEVVREQCNPRLRLYGILLTRDVKRLVLNKSMREMLDETAKEINTRIFHATIREAVTVREAAAVRKSIFSYAPGSKQAQDYGAFVDEFLRLEASGAWGN